MTTDQPGYTSPNAPTPQGPTGSGPNYPQTPGSPHEHQMQPQPPEPKKKSWFARHKILTGLGALLIIIVIGASRGGGSDNNEATAGAAQSDETGQSDTTTADDTQGEPADDAEQDEAPEAEPAQSLPGFGDPVQDGKFEFTVIGMETGLDTIGSDFLNTSAQGQFVLVDVAVTNVSEEAKYIFDSDQYLFDTQERKHSADTSAGIYLEDNTIFLNEINPGNTLEGTIVFDIPTDAVPESVELHDSAFSSGAHVGVAE